LGISIGTFIFQVWYSHKQLTPSQSYTLVSYTLFSLTTLANLHNVLICVVLFPL